MIYPIPGARLLLIQARNTPEIEVQEQECFLERCGLGRDQLRCVNVVREQLHEQLLSGIHAIMIGGAGEYSVVHGNAPWMENLLQFIHVLYDRRLPTFGSCWGHQLMARAFGGLVIHDSVRAELGCGTVSLTEAGRRDPLFADFPSSFRVNMGHHDRVVELPPEGIELAFNDSQRNQAFRMRDRPMYGTQFHSELDASRVQERLIAYRSYYDEISADDAYNEVVKSLAETTEVDHLLNDFLRKFVTQTES